MGGRITVLAVRLEPFDCYGNVSKHVKTKTSWTRLNLLPGCEQAEVSAKGNEPIHHLGVGTSNMTQLKESVQMLTQGHMRRCQSCVDPVPGGVTHSHVGVNQNRAPPKKKCLHLSVPFKYQKLRNFQGAKTRSTILRNSRVIFVQGSKSGTVQNHVLSTINRFQTASGYSILLRHCYPEETLIS